MRSFDRSFYPEDSGSLLLKGAIVAAFYFAFTYIQLLTLLTYLDIHIYTSRRLEIATSRELVFRERTSETSLHRWGLICGVKKPCLAIEISIGSSEIISGPRNLSGLARIPTALSRLRCGCLRECVLTRLYQDRLQNG